MVWELFEIVITLIVALLITDDQDQPSPNACKKRHLGTVLIQGRLLPSRCPTIGTRTSRTETDPPRDNCSICFISSVVKSTNPRFNFNSLITTAKLRKKMCVSSWRQFLESTSNCWEAPKYLLLRHLFVSTFLFKPFDTLDECVSVKFCFRWLMIRLKKVKIVMHSMRWSSMISFIILCEMKKWRSIE